MEEETVQSPEQITSVPPSTAIPEILPTSAKPKPWLKIFLFSVLGTVAVSALIFGAYKFGQREVKPGFRATPTPVVVATPTPDPTANWKIYSSPDMSFKYPPDWVESGYLITSSIPKVRLVVVPKDGTLMTECMQETAVENKSGFVIRKFSRVTTGAMCGTSDATPRETWIMKSLTTYAPGVSYQYSSTESSQAESIFDQILSTFKFLEVKFLEESFSPTPTQNPITKNWKLYSDSKFAFTFRYPQDWSTEVKDFPKEDTHLINLAKQDTPTTFSLSFDIKPDWSGTGDAQFLAKNYEVGGVSALKVDPPKKDKQILERYQTNIYFEKGGRVYVFVCVHNWNEDYLNTCNDILSTFRFLE